MIAGLVAHGEHLDRRHQLLAAQRQLVRRVIGQPVAALLRFQQQRKGRIAADVDARDRVHLDGDIQFHGAGPQVGSVGEGSQVLASNAANRWRGRSPRRNQHGVETQIEFGMFGMRHQPRLRGIDDAPLLARRHRIGGLIEAGAGLDLDKDQ